MSEPVFALATAEDVETIVNLRIRFSNELVGAQPADKEAALRESLHNYFSEELNKSYFCWIAWIEGEAVAVNGMGLRIQPGNVVNPSGRWGYIMSVYTHPAHRRKGLSGELLNRMLATGREMGLTAFELHATHDGEPVYIKNGFKIHPEPTYRKFF